MSVTIVAASKLYNNEVELSVRLGADVDRCSIHHHSESIFRYGITAPHPYPNLQCVCICRISNHHHSRAASSWTWVLAVNYVAERLLQQTECMNKRQDQVVVVMVGSLIYKALTEIWLIHLQLPESLQAGFDDAETDLQEARVMIPAAAVLDQLDAPRGMSYNHYWVHAANSEVQSSQAGADRLQHTRKLLMQQQTTIKGGASLTILQQQETVLGKELATTKVDDVAVASAGRGRTSREILEDYRLPHRKFTFASARTVPTGPDPLHNSERSEVIP